MKKKNLLILLPVLMILAACSMNVVTNDDLIAIRKGMSCDAFIEETEVHPDEVFTFAYRGHEVLPYAQICEPYIFEFDDTFTEIHPQLASGDSITFLLCKMEVGSKQQNSGPGVGVSFPITKVGPSFQTAPNASFQMGMTGGMYMGMGMGGGSSKVSEPYAVMFVNDQLVYWGFYHEFTREYSINITKQKPRY